MFSLACLKRWTCLACLLVWAVSHAAVLGDEVKETPPAVKIREALEQPVTLDYAGHSLRAALAHISEKTKIPLTLDNAALLNLDPDDRIPFTIKSDNGKLRQALERMLRPLRLAFVIVDGGVLVTFEDLAIYRQMRQRVSVHAHQTPLSTVLKELSDTTGISIIVDPAVETWMESTVTLELDDSTIETAVRLLAELVKGTKAVRLDNVLFITSDAKASKIRKEETANQAFDSRMSGNLFMPSTDVFRGFMAARFMGLQADAPVLVQSERSPAGDAVEIKPASHSKPTRPASTLELVAPAPTLQSLLRRGDLPRIVPTPVTPPPIQLERR